MNREIHVPLREGIGVKFPWATRPSIVSLMDVELGIPDFSSISKRSGKLSRFVLNKAMKPGSHVIVDSCKGLKTKMARPANNLGKNKTCLQA